MSTRDEILVRMSGKIVDPPADGDFAALVNRLFPDAKVICSATADIEGVLIHGAQGIRTLTVVPIAARRYLV